MTETDLRIISSIKNAHRDKVLELLCETSSRGEQSVPVVAMASVRSRTTATLMAMGVSSTEASDHIKLAEQEAVKAYPSECERRRSTASAAKSDAESGGASSQSEASAAPAAETPNDIAVSTTRTPAKAAPIQIDLPEAIDEHDFTEPPYFSKSNPLHNSLKKLDASYRCYICRELYTNPVAVLHCLHTFCSECIRKHCKFNMTKNMKRECRCPQCNEFVSVVLFIPIPSHVPNRF